MIEDDSNRIDDAGWRKMNLLYAVPGPPQQRLAEMLATLSDKALAEMEADYQIEGVDGKSKGTRIATLQDKICERENVIAVVASVNDGFERSFFDEIVAHEEYVTEGVPIAAFGGLQGAGFVQIYDHGGQIVCVMPEELRQLIQIWTEDGSIPEVKHRMDELTPYAAAAVSLYGAIKLTDLVDIVCDMNPERYDRGDVKAFLITYGRGTSNYVFWHEYILHDLLTYQDVNAEEVARIASSAARYPRYIPDKDAFLRYADPEYIEMTPQLLALHEFLQTRFNTDLDATWDILEEVHHFAQSEARIQDVIDFIQSCDLHMKAKDMQALIPLLVEISKHTRLWVNNGHTPTELRALQGRGSADGEDVESADFLPSKEAMLERRAIHGPPHHRLSEMLADLGDLMDDVALVHGLSDLYDQDRQACLEALDAKLREADTLMAALLNAGEGDESQLQSMIEGKGQGSSAEEFPFAFFPTLHWSGIVFLYMHEGGFACVVPDEIRNNYQRIREEGLLDATKARYRIVRGYVLAAMHLYGLIPLDELLALIAGYDESLGEEEIRKHVSVYGSRDADFALLDDFVIDSTFYDYIHMEDEVQRIRTAAETKPRYIPNKSEFLRYADAAYYEKTLQVRAVERYFLSHYDVGPEEIEDIVQQFHFLSREDAEPKDFLDAFEEYGFERPRVLASQLAALITDLKNHTRKWVCNGHTPVELGEAEDLPSVRLAVPMPARSNEPKISRNAPCPCGSGKKYKLCCGMLERLDS